MGNPAMLEYETLDCETHTGKLDKTQTGGVKHNREMGLKTEPPPFGQLIRRPEAIEPEATMANDPLNQIGDPSDAAAKTDGCELDLSFGVPVEDKPIWTNLYDSIRDFFFPPKLPPLELTSTSIPVPDRMAVKPNPWAIGISTSINLTIVLVLLFFVGKKIIDTANKKAMIVTPVDVATDYIAPKADSEAGGGGGRHDNMEAIKGRTPPRAKPLDIDPKVIQAPVPTIDVQNNIIIPDNPTLPNFGVSKSTNVKLDSGGNGTGLGMGNGKGNGLGDGIGGNIGGGVFHIGGEVSAPKLIFAPEAEFSDEARRAKYQGKVLVEIIVDAQGNPQNPRVMRSLGMGLDEQALKVVLKYKFKPAMRNGKPVAVWQPVEIDFHLY